MKQARKGFRKRYQVEITETLQKVIDVTAYSAEEAISKVKEQYQNEEIVLDSSDFIDYTIGIYQ